MYGDGDNRDWDAQGDSHYPAHDPAPLRSSQNDYYEVNASEKPRGSYTIPPPNTKKQSVLYVKETNKPRNLSDDATWNIAHLCLYLLFITIVYIITSGTRNHERYYMSKVIYELFIDREFEGYGGAATTFRDSSTINDFWGFTDHMNEGLYRSKWYWEKNNAIQLAKASNVEGEKYDNKLVGRARLRQIRVQNTTCPIHNYFNRLSRTCFPEYEESYEDTYPIREGSNDLYAGWTYSKHKEFHSIKYFGSLGVYSSAGYLAVLDTNEEETNQILIGLRNDVWIGRSTRAIILDFTFYNSNINTFCVVRLAWEMPSTGGVSTSWNIQTIQYMKYETRYEIFVFVCQIIFILFILFYFIEEIYFLVTQGWRKYFTNLWTYVTILMFALSIYCIQHTIRRYLHLTDALKGDITSNSKEDVSIFQELAFWENVYNSTISTFIGLMWISLLKFLSFIPPVAQLYATMSTCAKDVGGFGIIFLIVFMSFTQLGHFVFGNQVLAFSTLGRSIFTLIAFVLGYFDYQSIVDANRLIGPIFFVAFVVFVFMILINMFLAIVNLSYHTVMERKVHFKVPNKNSNSNTCCKCCRPTPKAENTTANNILINPEEIKLELLKHQFSEVEIAIFFNRFDIHDSGWLDVDDSHKLLSDVTSNSFTSRNESPMNPPHPHRRKSKAEKPLSAPLNADLEREEHFSMLHRLGAIESAVIEITPKFDSLLDNLSLYVKRQNKKNRLKQ